MAVRVLQVLDKISVDSGVSSMVMSYYKRLDHSRVTFDFMLNEDTDEATRAFIEGKGSRIYIMPALKVKNLLRYVMALKSFYSKTSYRIVHGHVPNSAVFYLGMAKHVPCKIIHSHSTRLSDVFWKQSRNWILTRFLKQVANRYAACSEEAAVFLFGSNEKVAIFNNAIDVQRFSFRCEKRKCIRQSLGLADELLIGHVGRFCAAKNHRFILSVFNEVYQTNKNARLLLIGDGELKQEMMRRAEALGIGDVVFFLGAIENVGEYMSAMDVFILPSLFEGLGLVGVEAQAAGLSVLASERVPKMMDVIGNVQFLRLDRQLWVNQLLSIEFKDDRLEEGSKVQGSRYDMDTQIEELHRYYEQCL